MADRFPHCVLLLIGLRCNPQIWLGNYCAVQTANGSGDVGGVLSGCQFLGLSDAGNCDLEVVLECVMDDSEDGGVNVSMLGLLVLEMNQLLTLGFALSTSVVV